MITLGINAAFHDSAAALVVDGKVLAAAEEERFTRIKHAKRPLPFTAWELPFHAMDFCLAQAGITLAEVDHVAYSYDPAQFIRDRHIGELITLPLSPSAHPPGAGTMCGTPCSRPTSSMRRVSWPALPLTIWRRASGVCGTTGRTDFISCLII